MGLPSPIDQDRGRVVSNNILPGWINRTPAHDLQQRIHLPVLLDNDANLAALGEITYAAAAGARNLIYVKASTGIGTGLVFEGHLYRGDTRTAGELGHVQIQPDGAICRCGNCGCLETLVSVPHVLASLQPMHREPLTISHVVRLIAAGDVSARRVVTDAGRAIGRALALCNVLNSGALIIGGELAATGTPFTAGIREAIDHHTQPVIADAVTISASTLAARPKSSAPSPSPFKTARNVPGKPTPATLCQQSQPDNCPTSRSLSAPSDSSARGALARQSTPDGSCVWLLKASRRGGSGVT